MSGMSDSSEKAKEPARRAGRAVARVLNADRRRREAALAEDQRLQERHLNSEDQRADDRLNVQDGRDTARLAEQEEQPDSSRRGTAPMSFALRWDLKERLTKFRGEGGTINVSGICNDAIERELDRQETGNAVVQRLLVELTDRRGPSWTLGYQRGKKWAEETASWLEITEFATRYTSRDIAVKALYEGEPEMYYVFAGRFRSPERDYGHDAPGGNGAPGFTYTADNGEIKWQWNTAETESHWRGWLTAVREVYEESKTSLPSVIDELAPEPARDVDSDEIPF
jgi:hypothetical protein